MTRIRSENLGCLAGLFGFGARGRGAGADSKFNYRTRDDFLSQAEAAFFRVLQRAVGSDGVVFAKVGMGDVLFVPRGENEVVARNKIDRKHFDFVLCDPRTFKVVLVIELDDRSHANKKAAERDAHKDLAAQIAGLPLLRVPVRASYDPAELRSGIERILGRSNAANPAANVLAVSADVAASPVLAAMTESAAIARSAPSEVPQCPKCGVAMVLRRSRNNPSGAIHQQFFGCENYPRCRETKPFSAGTGNA